MVGENQGVFFMNKIPNALTVICFDDKEQAKRQSKLVYRETIQPSTLKNKQQSARITCDLLLPVRLFIFRKFCLHFSAL